MTATTSTSKNFILVHFKNKISENRKLIFITTFLQLLGLPVISLLAYLSAKELSTNIYDTDYNFFMTLSALAFLAAILMGVFIITSNFKYLHNHAFSDMQLALPLTAKQRFWIDYFSGLLIYLLPAVFAMLLASIPLFMGAANYPLYFDNIDKILPSFAIIIIIGMIMFYTFAVFSVVYCGTLIDSLINIFLINAVIPLTLIATSISIEEGFLTTSTSSDIPILMSQIVYTSPIGCAIMILFNYDNIFIFNSPIIFRWILSACAVIALFLVLSYIIYKKRKAEQVATPYVFKIFYHIFMFFTVFCIFNLINSLYSSTVYASSYPSYYYDTPYAEEVYFENYAVNILPAIITSAVVFFIAEFISNRGIKKFFHSVARFAFAIVFAVAFRKICIVTEGFGYSEYIPNANSVKYVSFNDYSDTVYLNSSSSLYYNDKQIIEKITNLHSEILNNASNDNAEVLSEFEFSKLIDDTAINLCNDMHYITINYIMKNGSIVSRNYQVPFSQLSEIIPYIVTSDTYTEQIITDLKYTIKQSRNNKIKITDNFENSIAISLNESDTDKLCEAYKKDASTLAPEDFYHASGIVRINGDFNDIPISGCYTNTISLLEEFVLEQYDLEKDFTNIKPHQLITHSVAIYPNIINAQTIYNNRLNEFEYTIHKNFIDLGYGTYTDYPTNIEFDKCADEICELLKYANHYYDNNANGGVIIVDNIIYYLPVEYKEKLNEIYNKYKIDAEYKVSDDMDLYYSNEKGEKIYVDSLTAGYFIDEIGIYNYDEKGNKNYIRKYNSLPLYD